MKSLYEILIRRYPELKMQFRIEADGSFTRVEIPFKNDRFFGWIEKDEEGYIVGINDLHGHFDAGTEEENLKQALDYFDGIVNNEVAAVSLKEGTTKYLLAILPTEQAIAIYGSERPQVEIETLRRSC